MFYFVSDLNGQLEINVEIFKWLLVLKQKMTTVLWPFLNVYRDRRDKIFFSVTNFVTAVTNRYQEL